MYFYALLVSLGEGEGMDYVPCSGHNGLKYATVVDGDIGSEINNWKSVVVYCVVMSQEQILHCVSCKGNFFTKLGEI